MCPRRPPAAETPARTKEHRTLTRARAEDGLTPHPLQCATPTKVTSMKICKRVSLVLFLALLPWGCSSDESGGSNTPATGGTSGSGGSAGVGAATTGGSSGSSGSGGSSTAGVGGTAEDAGSDVTTYVYPPCMAGCGTIAQVCNQSAMDQETCVSGCTDASFDPDCGQLLKAYLACFNLTPEKVVCDNDMGLNPDCAAEGSAFAACDSAGN